MTLSTIWLIITTWLPAYKAATKKIKAPNLLVLKSSDYQMAFSTYSDSWKLKFGPSFVDSWGLLLCELEIYFDQYSLNACLLLILVV